MADFSDYQGTALFRYFLLPDENPKLYIYEYPFFNFVWKWFLLATGLWFAYSAQLTLDHYFGKTLVPGSKARKYAFMFQCFVVSSPLYASIEHLSDAVLLFGDFSIFQSFRTATQGVGGTPILECFKATLGGAVASSGDCSGKMQLLSWIFMWEGAVGLLTHIGTMWYLMYHMEHAKSNGPNEETIKTGTGLLVLTFFGLAWNTIVLDGEYLEWYISHGFVHVFHHIVSVTWFHRYMFSYDFEKELPKKKA